MKQVMDGKCWAHVGIQEVFVFLCTLPWALGYKDECGIKADVIIRSMMSKTKEVVVLPCFVLAVFCQLWE